MVLTECITTVRQCELTGDVCIVICTNEAYCMDCLEQSLKKKLIVYNISKTHHGEGPQFEPNKHPMTYNRVQKSVRSYGLLQL